MKPLRIFKFPPPPKSWDEVVVKFKLNDNKKGSVNFGTATGEKHKLEISFKDGKNTLAHIYNKGSVEFKEVLKHALEKNEEQIYTLVFRFFDGCKNVIKVFPLNSRAVNNEVTHMNYDEMKLDQELDQIDYVELNDIEYVKEFTFRSKNTPPETNQTAGDTNCKPQS